VILKVTVKTITIIITNLPDDSDKSAADYGLNNSIEAWNDATERFFKNG